MAVIKKRVYIPWDKREKRELRPWLARHRHLPWKKIREEYHRQKKKPRSIHSIRSKYDQLEKELSMVMQSKALSDSDLHSGPTLLSQLPPSPSPLVLPPMDPLVQQMIERWRQKMHLSQPTQAEHELPSEDELSPPSLLSQLPPSPSPLVLPPMDPSVQQMMERWRQWMHLSQPVHAEHELSSEDELSAPATPLSWEPASLDGLEVYDDDPWDGLGLDFRPGQDGVHDSPAQTWH